MSHPVGNRRGFLQRRTDRHCHIDTDHTLIHVRYENHIGGENGNSEDRHHSRRRQHSGFQMMDKIVQQPEVAVFEVLHPHTAAQQKATFLLFRLLQPLSAHFLFVQHEIAQQRHQRQRDHQRCTDQRCDGQAEVTEHHASQAVDQSQRQKYRQCGQRRRHHRRGDLLRSINTGAHAVVPIGGKTVNIFQHNDRVVHDHADAHGNAAQAHHIHRQVEGLHQQEYR